MKLYKVKFSSMAGEHLIEHVMAVNERDAVTALCSIFPVGVKEITVHKVCDAKKIIQF